MCTHDQAIAFNLKLTRDVQYSHEYMFLWLLQCFQLPVSYHDNDIVANTFFLHILLNRMLRNTGKKKEKERKNEPTKWIASVATSPILLS